MGNCTHNAKTRPAWIWEWSELWADLLLLFLLSPLIIEWHTLSAPLLPSSPLKPEKQRTSGEHVSPLWSPKEIKHGQLPGKSNKVYHSVCHDVVFGRWLPQKTDKWKRKNRLKNDGWEKSRHQRLNPECDKKRGIIVLATIMIILLVQDR